jgi:heterokaryon incompatibility protein (HET)
MRLLKCGANGKFSLTEELGDKHLPKYAILSHRWGPPGDEVTFEDFKEECAERKAGYNKIQFCGEQAVREGLKYFWVDSCCIDKANFTELSKSINSMFKWYRQAASCYVYLSDVPDPNDPTSTPESAFQMSNWFSRGWTLQELIAPKEVQFFTHTGNLLGDKKSLEQQIHHITGIATEALQGKPLSEFSIDERLSWAAKRETTVEEDAAYCMLGIFDIHMPLIYGEGGQKALDRLRRKIQKSSNSAFAMLTDAQGNTAANYYKVA